VTSRIELMAAVKPSFFHPGVLAKQAIEIDQISGGRFSVNVVNGWYMPELEKFGVARPHDERYEHGAEWLRVFKDLSAGRRVSRQGRYYAIDDLQLIPGPVQPDGPLVYSSGESEPALRLAAELADVYLLHARGLEPTTDLIDRLRPRERGGKAPLRYGTSAFVVARASEEEAFEAYDDLARYRHFGDTDTVHVGVDRAMEAAAGRGAHIESTAARTWGGTAAGLVGSYRDVAERIKRFHEAGVELFLLSFQPMESEAERFAAEVMPLLDLGD